MKGGHAARPEILRILPVVDLARIPNRGPSGNRLWLEAVLLGCGLLPPIGAQGQGQYRVAFAVRNVDLATTGPALDACYDGGAPLFFLRFVVFGAQDLPQNTIFGEKI